MGASTFPILATILCASLSIASGKPEVIVPTNLESREAVNRWATSEYFGGFSAHDYELKGASVVVVIGMPTSGLITSEIVVFRKGKHGYVLLLVRRQLSGNVEVDATESDLVFRRGQDTILVLPAAGL